MLKVTSSNSSTTTTNTAKRKRTGKYYAVRTGHNPGIYTSWRDCLDQVKGFKGAKFKSFVTEEEAAQFLAGSDPSLDPSSESYIPKFYGVRSGKVPGVYTSWAAAEAQVVGVLKPKVKCFLTHEEAEAFVTSASPPPSKKVKTSGSQSPVKKRTASSSVLKIYTDGSALGNGKSSALAGIGVWFGDKDPLNISEPLQGPRQTNQRAELTAILRAIGVAPLHRHVQIYTDSQYAINCVTVWHTNWIRNGWQTSMNKPVENQDLIEQILDKIRERQEYGSTTKFEWVKGHTGENDGNSKADELAVQGARMGLLMKT